MEWNEFLRNIKMSLCTSSKIKIQRSFMRELL